MIWFKAIGALILVGSGMWCARLLNGRAQAALRQAEGFAALLRTVKRLVDCYATALPQILAQCDAALLRACGYEGAIPPRDWDTLLRECAVLDEESVAAMRRFAAEFGRGNREEQVRACEYTLVLVEARREALAAALPAEKKRNTTLCLSAALGTAILLF